jgi:4-hydroxybenzoate polyprenyltransferase
MRELRREAISPAQKIAVGLFIAFGLWSTGRAVVRSVRERRELSKRKTYSLRRDLTVLMLSSMLAVGAGLLLMLALDSFGLMRKPYIWVSAAPLIAAWLLGNRLREKVELRRAHVKPRRLRRINAAAEQLNAEALDPPDS